MSPTGKDRPQDAARAAEIVREYGPFAGADRVAGVTHDGQHVWAATGSRLAPRTAAGAVSITTNGAGTSAADCATLARRVRMGGMASAG